MSTTDLVDSKEQSSDGVYSFTRKKVQREAPNLRSPHSPIKVIVGKDEEKISFAVYKDFLTFYSPYFEHALAEGTFMESNGVVELDHVDSSVFGLFVDWLYTQEVKDLRCENMAIKDEVKREREDKPSLRELVSLWIVADYFQIPALQNKTMDLIIKKDSRTKLPRPSNGLIVPVYEETLPGSKLRKAFVNMCYWNGFNRDRLLSHPEEFPKDFLLDLTFLYAGSRSGSNPINSPAQYQVQELE